MLVAVLGNDIGVGVVGGSGVLGMVRCDSRGFPRFCVGIDPNLGLEFRVKVKG